MKYASYYFMQRLVIMALMAPSRVRIKLLESYGVILLAFWNNGCIYSTIISDYCNVKIMFILNYMILIENYIPDCKYNIAKLIVASAQI